MTTMASTIPPLVLPWASTNCEKPWAQSKFNVGSAESKDFQ
jgi:hypothetical protein